VLQGHIPFAVVGSMEEVKVGNKMVKARQYPWGTVQGSKISYMYKKICSVSVCFFVPYARPQFLLAEMYYI